MPQPQTGSSNPNPKPARPDPQVRPKNATSHDEFAVAQIPRQPSKNAAMFDTTTRAHRWKEFRERGICTGRLVDLEPKYKGLISDHLDALGWGGILNIPVTVYPSLVRYFYCNLVVIESDEDFKISSFVKGVEITLGVDKIAALFRIPTDGTQVYFPKSKKVSSEMVDVKDEVHETLTGKPNLKGALMSNDLLPELQLLNHYITDNVLPRGGGFDRVTSFQSYLLYNIVKRNHLCLPYILLKEMALAGSTDKSLPFGGLLTRVFEHHGIDLLGEDTTSLKDPFNSASVARIGKKNQKAEHEPQVADTEDSDDAPEPREVHMTDVGGQTQGEQQPHDGRFHPSLEDLYHRQYELEQQFRQFGSDNQATLGGIQSSLGDLHGKMDQVLHYFQHYPLPPQPPHEGRFQPSLHDLYHQFREFRSDNQSSLGDLHGKMDQVLHYFQHYPPPPPPPQP